MIAAAALSIALAIGQPFEAEFPGAAVRRAEDGQILQASGFSAPARGTRRVEAAIAFLAARPEDFSVGARQRLSGRQEGRRVRVSRSVDGRPVFEGDVVVGFDARGRIFLVNARPVAAEPSGACAVPLRGALATATAAVGEGRVRERRARRGWYSVGSALRPAWKVEIATREPSGHWRLYVDATTGAVLVKIDLRVSSEAAR